MPFQPVAAGGVATNGRRFVLYVEGARDRDIVRGWSHRLLPAHTRRIASAAVILGGRQPARAVEHFRRLGGADDGSRALCVLDRDDGSAAPPEAEDGVEFFTWSRRHIESYLLVPAAIRRALRLPDGDGLVERALARHLPASGDESAYGQVDAKRLLGPASHLARALDRPLPLGSIARATRVEELHPDVLALFDRLSDALGLHVTRVLR